MNHLITIPFHNQTITAIDHNGKPYIAMRPIVENLGLDWSSQRKKIVSRFNRSAVLLAAHDSLNRKQEMLCLPLIKLPSFLNTISVSKVNPELRERIAIYQDECDEVLFNPFMQQQSKVINALISPLFAKHPQWQETRDLFAHGFSTHEISGLQGKNQRNVQRMIARIKKAGINCHLANRIQAI